MTEVQFARLDERPDRMADVVYEAIRQSIMDRTLPPGARVTESGVAEQLHVSKTPVREALLRLRKIGVVEPDGVRGARVVRPSRTGVRHAYEVREALEVFAVRTVAGHVAADELERICKAAARSRVHAGAGDQVGFRKWDSVFHRSIAEAAANPRLLELIDDVFTLIVTLRQRDYPNVDSSIECANAHIRIADAITRRDVEAAETAMRDHVRQVEGYVLAVTDLTDVGGSDLG